MDVEKYFRSVFAKRLSINEEECKDLAGVNSSVFRLLEVREECASVSRALEAQKEEMQIKRSDAREREEHMKREEEKQRETLLHYNRFLQENDARRLRAIKKMDAERAQARLKEQELLTLQTESGVLEAQKELLQERAGKVRCYHEFFQRAVKMSGKFENPGQLINRLQGLLSVRKELVEKLRVMEAERESAAQELMRYTNQQRMVLLHANNQLQQLHAELHATRSVAHGWELKLKHFHSTAAKETLEFANLKTTICNIYQMIISRRGTRGSQHTDDAFKQLEMIIKYFQLMESIHYDLQERNQTEEETSGETSKQAN